MKYITNLQLTVENSDLLMFQLNNLSFDSSNVSLELHERTVGAVKQRVLAFKATSCFMKKEPPIDKILLMIDATMIAAKFVEPEVQKPTYANRDYLKPQ